MSVIFDDEKTDFRLGKLIGGPQLLPGESLEQYEAGLSLLISDLKTSRPLAVLLTESLYESMIWVRRHQLDKERLIFQALVEEIKHDGVDDDGEYVAKVYNALIANPDDEQAKFDFDQMFEHIETFPEIRARVMRREINCIKVLDELVANQLNSVRHLLKSLMALELQPILRKRLKLEIQKLEEDTKVIGHE